MFQTLLYEQVLIGEGVGCRCSMAWKLSPWNLDVRGGSAVFSSSSGWSWISSGCWKSLLRLVLRAGEAEQHQVCRSKWRFSCGTHSSYCQGWSAAFWVQNRGFKCNKNPMLAFWCGWKCHKWAEVADLEGHILCMVSYVLEGHLILFINSSSWLSEEEKRAAELFSEKAVKLHLLVYLQTLMCFPV